MNVISQEQIHQIRTSVDIVDIVSKYIPLVPKGKNFFGICPFHDDNHPSMSVSREKQIYTCFSCGATGNVIKFVEEYEHISFPEALKLLANEAGITIDIGISKKKTMKDSVLYEIYELSSKLYHNNINTIYGKEAKAYLKERNIDEQVIKEFQIGLSLNTHDMLSKLLTSKKYEPNILLKSGLIHKTDEGYLDSYYNRIMFPLYNISGQVVGFSGRIYHGEKDMPKYINTKETEIFKKGELLYNYHRAKEEARRVNMVIVMEGFMDVIRAYTVGITNVIATMGTAVTKEQALLMKRMAKDIILCFDGDEAGGKATFSCIEELTRIGVTPKVIRLEDNLDPDEYIQKYGKERFLGKLENPINIMDFKLSYLKKKKDLSSNQDVASYVGSVLNELTKIDDDILKELTLQKISQESKLDIDFLKAQLEKKETPVSKTVQTVSENKKKDKYEKAQMYLLYYMLRSSEVIRRYNQKITFMPNERFRNLAFHISYYYNKYGDIDIAALIDELEEQSDLLQTLGEIERLNLKENYTKEEIDDYLDTIREYTLKTGQAELSLKLKQETDTKEKIRIAQQLLDLKVRGEKND